MKMNMKKTGCRNNDATIAKMIFGAFILSLIFGCGPKLPETGTVWGHVTYNGEAVASDLNKNVECEIQFWPEDGRRPARGHLDENGDYRLDSFGKGDGAIPGQYKVAIKAVKAHPPAGGKGGRLEWLVSKTFSQTSSSGLTATVKKGDNEINFEIP